MLTKVFPVLLALAIAVGVITQIAFTHSGTYTVAEAPVASETAVVTLRGTVTRSGENGFVLEDRTGKVELQTCPAWYRQISLDQNERVTVTGEIIRNNRPPEGVLYSLAVYKIARQNKPEIVIRTGPGKPPWASSAVIPKTP